MRFELKAIGPGGAVEALDFQAPDEVTAVRQVEGRGYTVLSVRAKGSLGLPWRRGGERFPVALFSQELRVLLNAGLPLPEAIDTLAQKEKRGDWRGIIERLVEVLREGQTFSSALEEFPQIFSPLYVATVRSSEKTSDLAPALGRYVAYAAQARGDQEARGERLDLPHAPHRGGRDREPVPAAYVVPRFGRIYEERGSALPLFSAPASHWGKRGRPHAPVVLSVLGGLILLGVYALRLANVRTAIGDALWRLPALGERLKMYQLRRFYRTIGMLLRGGTPLVAALDMGGELLHPLLRERLARASQAIREAAACRSPWRPTASPRRWRCAC
jgi:general secretion pathway protein F